MEGEYPTLQEVAVGHLVLSRLGADIQTRQEGDLAELWIRQGPNLPVAHYIVFPDGRVHEDK